MKYQEISLEESRKNSLKKFRGESIRKFREEILKHSWQESMKNPGKNNEGVPAEISYRIQKKTTEISG